MNRTYTIDAQAYDAICAAVSKARAILHTVDEAQLLDHIDCPEGQREKVHTALEMNILALEQVRAAEAHISADTRRSGGAE